MKKLSSWNQWVKQRNLVQWFACDFQIHKKGHLQTLKIFTHTPKHPPDPPPSSHINNKHTSNVRKNHHTNIMRINILQPLISTKQKYITNACIPKLL